MKNCQFYTIIKVISFVLKQTIHGIRYRYRWKAIIRWVEIEQETFDL